MKLMPLVASAAPVTNGNGHKPARALTAAADGIADAQISGGGGAGRTPSRQAWQGEAWGYYDSLPELHYVAQFVGSCLSRVRLRLGWRMDNGDIAPVFDQDGNIDEDCPVDMKTVLLAAVVLGAFRDPLGGVSSLMEGMGKNLSITGELHLLGTDFKDDQGKTVARRWEVLSTDEIRRKPNVSHNPDGSPKSPEFERIWWGGGRPAQDIPLGSFVLRVYRRHPRFGHLADSACRPLLDIMEIIVLVARQLRSAILSRLAGAGVLWIPNEIDYPDDETAPEGSEALDPFTRVLMRTMSTPITDRGSASAVVPLVLRADADLIPSVHHLTFDTKDDENAIAKMDALLQRFAQGIDVPVEVVLGHQQTTFANAAQIDESTFKAHLEPMVELICGFLTAGYLWPSLGATTPADAPFDEPLLIPITDPSIQRLVVTFDASQLITHENREQNAVNAMKMSPPIIAAAAARRALGFQDSDAPDDDERNEWIRVHQLIRVSEAIRAQETGTGGVSMQDPDVQKALAAGDTVPPQADDATLGV